MTDEFKARHGIKVKITSRVNDDRDHRFSKPSSLSVENLDFDARDAILASLIPEKSVKNRQTGRPKKRKFTGKGEAFFCLLVFQHPVGKDHQQVL